MDHRAPWAAAGRRELGPVAPDRVGPRVCVAAAGQAILACAFSDFGRVHYSRDWFSVLLDKFVIRAAKFRDAPAFQSEPENVYEQVQIVKDGQGVLEFVCSRFTKSDFKGF